MPGPALGARECETVCNSSASDDDGSPSTLIWCFFETLQQVTGNFFVANIYVHRFEMLRETFLGLGLKPVDAKDDVEKYFLQFGPIRDCYMPACQLREHSFLSFPPNCDFSSKGFSLRVWHDANFVNHVTREQSFSKSSISSFVLSQFRVADRTKVPRGGTVVLWKEDQTGATLQDMNRQW